MAVKLGDIVSQAGADTYRLMKGKDLDISQATAEHTTLGDTDAFLVDVAKAGTQASTDYITASTMKAYFQQATDTTAELTDISASGSADGQVLIYNNSGSTYTPATLTQGTDIGITNSAAGISIAYTGSSTLDIAADSGSDDGVVLGTDTLTINGTSNEIVTAVTGDTITISLPTNVTIAGDLTVTGNTISTSAEIIEIASNTLILNHGHSAAEPSSAGIVVERGSTGDNALLYWSKVSSGADTAARWEIGTNAEADLATSPDYKADVMQVRIDNAAINTSSTEVPVGHMQYHGGDLYLRVEN